MKHDEWVAIRTLVAAGRHPTEIAALYPHVLYDAIVSAWSAHGQERELRALKTMRKAQTTGSKEACARRLQAGEPLHAIATQLGMSPCALARELLTEAGLTKPQIKDAIKNPPTVVGAFSTQAAAASSSSVAPGRLPPSSSYSSQRVGDLLAGVAPERWCSEIQQCVDRDTHNSPFLDAVKHLTGQEYESLLESHLTALGVPFATERSLRLAGKSSKTPDFVLLSPLLVHGHVVNWIDSKAHFADPQLKREHIEGQLRQYVNRDGTGMVIYWMDFVEDEPDSCTRSLPLQGASASSSTTATAAAPSPFFRFASPALDEHDQILLLTNFPTDVTTMDQLLLKELRLKHQPAVQHSSSTPCS